MADHESVSEFLRRLEAGNKSALDEVYGRYAEKLSLFAERQIGQRLQSLYDAEDASNSAMASFCRCAADGRYHFDHTGALLRLLKTFVLNKIRKRAKHWQADVSKKVPLDVEQSFLGDPAREDVVDLADSVETFLRRFQPLEANILRLWLEDCPSIRIAVDLKISKDTVNRRLQDIIPRLREWLGKEFAA